MRSLIKVGSLVFVYVALVAGCKVITTVPLGGKVTYGNGQNYCIASQTCETEVTDSAFDETFFAVPEEGFAFMQWRDQQDGLCRRKSKPCRVFTLGFDEFPSLMEIIDSDKAYYMDPIFSPISQGVGCDNNSVPSSFTAFASTSQMLAFLRDVDSCTFISSGEESPFEGIAFYTFSTGEIFLDGPFSVVLGKLRPGDLIMFFKYTETSETLLSGSANSLVLYIDADNDPTTGQSLHGVLGADYRTYTSNDSSVPGFLAKWSQPDERWSSVPDEDYGNKTAIYTGPVENGWQTVLFTGMGSESIGIPPSAVLRIEKKQSGCTICNNNPKVLATENVFQN